ncbi:hypothetical protein LRS10_08800 [Phenylobacterium sp. J426]|uniref:hypothetical protein n=1 Tax=Phenylobacterium sp. J426 TaxID=2898439 RepID=UPI002151E017|nr:hypothetical protein [Phenylobacterium sp. J426]MCR5873967.1 hypothetical protein [Phenylobacterium sp. J426]MCR5874254.1 hypothetical protein [Phenylobacterium sp. J426]
MADIDEGKSDPARGLYISNYLNERGALVWPDLLLEAARSGNDDSLSGQLAIQGCFQAQVERRKPSGGYTFARVPVTAPQTLAESQFNMYYMRALALRALEIGAGLIVYRAKWVENPRSSSEQMIGTTLDPAEVLSELRATRGVNPPSHIPLPNTGLTVRLGPAKSAVGVRVVGE